MGYHVIEPRSLGLALSSIQSRAAVRLILEYVLAQAKESMGERILGYRIDIIDVSYIGSYPAYGVWCGENGEFADETEAAVAAAFETEVDRIVQTDSLWNLLRYVESRDKLKR